MKTKGKPEVQDFLIEVENHVMPEATYISKNQNIIIGCPGGVRSSKVFNLLIRKIHSTVANLDGGFAEWKTKGYPWESKLSFDSGCRCGCISGQTNKNKTCY